VIRAAIFSALALVLAAPAWADAPVIVPPAVTPVIPRQLSDSERDTYRQIFQALHSHDYQTVSDRLASVEAGALTPVAEAELMLASPAARNPDMLTALLTSSKELPEAPTLARFSADHVTLPPQHPLMRAAGPSKRATARANRDCAALAAKVQPLLRTDDAIGAEPLVEAAADRISPEALTEWREKVAWTYFQTGDDASARRVAALAQVGAGDWAVDAAWVYGLASWRAHDFAAAGTAFDRVASNAGDDETRAAGLFWAARSKNAVGDNSLATSRLEAASRLSETFYGMLAGAALGEPALSNDWPRSIDMQALLRHPNLRAAAALVEIGETDLADQMIRYQARIGAPGEHGQLIGFAAALNLPATQVWLAQNAPAGAHISLAARYPRPGWAPAEGWRVDPALVYAHALQESEMRTDAVSRAGARGLMQLMPATAQLIARHKGDSVGSLDDPSVSFEYGQSYLEELAAAGGTNGLLPKVIAAYNAGPNNVARWTAGADDPLLFIESIPFAQTRAYVAIVLRNYWVYQRESGTPTSSMTALAAGRWPSFPERGATRTASAQTEAGAATLAPN
jgi:soluble lytic murein transglycosylase-like protein